MADEATLLPGVNPNPHPCLPGSCYPNPPTLASLVPVTPIPPPLPPWFLSSPVVVGEVTPGGAAEKTGGIVAGDVLKACSAVVLKSGKEGQYEAEGYGQRPFDNWERVTFDCTGQDFKTVMAALRSNNPRWGFKDVELEFDRPALPREGVERS